MTVDTSPELLHRMAADPHGYSEVFLGAVLQAVAAEKSREPAGWIRQHPDGTLTGEFLSPAQIEPARKTSGAWVPVYRAPQPAPHHMAAAWGNCHSNEPCGACLGTGVEGDVGRQGETIDVECGWCRGTGNARLTAAEVPLPERAGQIVEHELNAERTGHLVKAVHDVYTAEQMRSYAQKYADAVVPPPPPQPPAGEHRAAILLADHAMLAALLRLPAGAYIDHVEAPCNQPGTLRMRVRGAGWPVMLGHLLRQSTGRLTRRFTPEGDELLYEIDWDFPSDGEQQKEGPRHGN